MCEYGRRLVVQRSFDRALWSVMEAFVREGFVLTACSVRRLGACTTGHDPRRWVVLQATHADIALNARELGLDAGEILPCEIAVCEIATGETTVIVGASWDQPASSERGRTTKPPMAAITRKLKGRVDRALDAVNNGGPSRVAAA